MIICNIAMVTKTTFEKRKRHTYEQHRSILTNYAVFKLQNITRISDIIEKFGQNSYKGKMSKRRVGHGMVSNITSFGIIRDFAK